MKVWGAAKAKAQFSAVLDDVDQRGPQTLSRRGTGRYIVLREEEWNTRTRPEQNLVDFLNSPPADGVDVEFVKMKGKPRPVRF